MTQNTISDEEYEMLFNIKDTISLYRLHLNSVHLDHIIDYINDTLGIDYNDTNDVGDYSIPGKS